MGRKCVICKTIHRSVTIRADCFGGADFPFLIRKLPRSPFLDRVKFVSGSPTTRRKCSATTSTAVVLENPSRILPVEAAKTIGLIDFRPQRWERVVS